jgi:hypothetical protein
MIRRGKEPALEPIEDVPNLAALAEVLAAQVHGLNRVFTRAVQDMLLGKTRSFRDVGRALKAQDQCRTAFRVLLALRAAMEMQKKSRNRTDELLKGENRDHHQDLGRAPSEGRSCPDRAQPQEIGLITRAGGQNLRRLRRRTVFHSIDIGPATRALIPSPPANCRGIASPAAPRRRWIQRAPRRRWRIAS